MAQMPNERSLVSRYQDTNVIFLGVNGDEDRAVAQDAIEKFGLSGPIVWNGEEGPRGGLATTLGVDVWPQFVIYSPSGVEVARFADLEKVAGLLERLQADGTLHHDVRTSQ
jgi:hypothetical protein